MSEGQNATKTDLERLKQLGPGIPHEVQPIQEQGLVRGSWQPPLSVQAGN